MKESKLVVKARQDLDRLINCRPSIEDEPDKDLKASFILNTLHTDSYDDQNKHKVRSDPAARGGGKFTTDRKDALQALKIALHEVEEEDAVQEEKERSPPKPARTVRRRLPVYQENVPQPQEPRQPRVGVQRPPPARQAPPPPAPPINPVPAPVAAPQAVHGAFQQPFDLASVITSIAIHHMQQHQLPIHPPPAGPPPPARLPAPVPVGPPHPAEVAMAVELQRHILQFMQQHSAYSLGIAPLAIPGPPPLPAHAPAHPPDVAALARELQQHIARFMQAQGHFMYHVRAPNMQFPPPAPFQQYWGPRSAENNAENLIGGEGSTSATSANMNFKPPGDLKDTNHNILRGNNNKSNTTKSSGRKFGKNIPLNGADDKTAPQENDDNLSRRQSQRKIKKPVRNDDEAFQFVQKKEKRVRTVNNAPLQMLLNNSKSKAQPSQEAKRGIASSSAAAPATATALAAPVLPVVPQLAPVPVVNPLPAQDTIQDVSNTPTAAPNSLDNLLDESLEAQIKKKTITAVNAHYWPEMPEDIQEMVTNVLDFSKPYRPSGPSYFTAKIKALGGAAMYAAQLAVIERRVAWVVAQMNKAGIGYGWKKGKEPTAGSYEFYRGIALKYLRDRLKSRCRVEACKRDKY